MREFHCRIVIGSCSNISHLVCNCTLHLQDPVVHYRDLNLQR